MVLLGTCPAIYGQSPPMPLTNSGISSNSIKVWKSNIVNSASVSPATNYVHGQILLAAYPSNLCMLEQYSPDLISWIDCGRFKIDNQWHTNMNIIATNQSGFYRIVYTATNMVITNVP